EAAPGRDRGAAASMEPRSDERGISTVFRRFLELALELQWSRALMSAESSCPPPAPSSRAFASMEPRSDERGIFRWRAGGAERRDASMEPRSDERGIRRASRSEVPVRAGFNGAAL